MRRLLPALFLAHPETSQMILDQELNIILQIAPDAATASQRLDAD
jgi:hypothetical protein